MSKCFVIQPFDGGEFDKLHTDIEFRIKVVIERREKLGKSKIIDL